MTGSGASLFEAGCPDRSELQMEGEWGGELPILPTRPLSVKPEAGGIKFFLKYTRILSANDNHKK